MWLITHTTHVIIPKLNFARNNTHVFVVTLLKLDFARDTTHVIIPKLTFARGITLAKCNNPLQMMSN